jgi:thymidylate synthase (FAD)
MSAIEVAAIEIPVLDNGFVRLVDSMGNDLSVVNSARVSLGKRSDLQEDGTLSQSDSGLVGFLMRERHGTPFEAAVFQFHVKAPLFVVREWQRHRIASYNELSGRYQKFENPDFYVPDAENFRTQVGKPGAYSFERWKGNTKMVRATLESHYRDCMDLYEWQINQGVAKEQARIVLPLALYTEFYVTMNARSLMNFLSLRNADQAMMEMREFAKAVEQLWKEQMPITAEAFINNERIAP